MRPPARPTLAPLLLAAALIIPPEPAAAAPSWLLPEHPIDPPVVVPSLTQQLAPALAFDGKTFLAVWGEQAWSFEHGDVLGTRISPDGTLLDPGSLPIMRASLLQTDPDVAFNGEYFFVVYENTDIAADEHDIYLTRVNRDGLTLDPDGLPVCAWKGGQYVPAIACAPQMCLAAWTDFRGTNADVYAARILPDGTSLDPIGIPVSVADDDQGNPAVAFDGSRFLVAWADQRNSSGPAATHTDIYAARIHPNGMVLDPGGFVVSNAPSDQHSVAVAFDGVNYLLAWADLRNEALGLDFGPDIFGTRIQPDAVVLDPDGIPISTAPNNQEDPALAPDGDGAFVVWRDYRADLDGTAGADLWGARLLPDGTVASPDGLPLNLAPGELALPRVAAAPAGLVAVWEDQRFGPSDAFGTPISPDGLPAFPQGIPIALGQSEEHALNAALGAGIYLLAWQDSRNGGKGHQDIYGLRMSGKGEPLDAEAFPICTAAQDQFSPRVAFNGDLFVVVWQDFRHGVEQPADLSDIYAARVLPDATVLDPDGLPVIAGKYDQIAPAIACLGQDCLVAWSDWRIVIDEWGSTEADIYATFLLPDGTVSEPWGFPLVADPATQLAPALAAGPDTYALAWQDLQMGQSDILARVLDAAAVPLTPDPTLVSATWADENYPDIAPAPAGFLVVWEDYRNGPPDALAARLGPAGDLLDPDPLPAGSTKDNQRFPAVTFDGLNWLAAWIDDRNGYAHVFGARIDQGGSVLDPDGFELSSEPLPHSSPALESAGAGDALLLYTHLTLWGVTSAERGFVRVVDWLPDSLACAGPEQCASGSCVDGLCCDSPCANADPDDCLACSVASGAPDNGKCSLVLKGVSCRPATGPCDLVEKCDGNAAPCPPDLVLPDGTDCPGGSCLAGQCIPAPPDLAEALPENAEPIPEPLPEPMPEPLPEPVPDALLPEPAQESAVESLPETAAEPLPEPRPETAPEATAEPPPEPLPDALLPEPAADSAADLPRPEQLPDALLPDPRPEIIPADAAPSDAVADTAPRPQPCGGCATGAPSAGWELLLLITILGMSLGSGRAGKHTVVP